MTLLIVYAMIALVISFLCSIAEAVILSVRHPFIETLRQAGKRAGPVLLDLKERINQPLAAILTLNTIANTIGAAGVGAQATVVFGSAYLGVASGILTLLILICSEIIPKTLGALYWRQLAPVLALPIEYLVRALYPFVLLSRWITERLSSASHREAVTETELRMNLMNAATGGHLTRRERLIMENVLDLEKKPARRYMVPRHQIIYINRHDAMDEKLRIISESGHTRFPLCDEDLDHIIGIVHVKDIFKAMLTHDTLTSLVDMAREPLYLPETIRLDTLLFEFQRQQTIVAMLVDEYGVVSGMITLENVIEELVGPIQDEFDSEPPPIVMKGAHRYEVAASCPVDLAVKNCQITVPEDITADTIGGVIIALLGHIPEQNEHVTIGRHKITVLAAEPTRITRVLIEQTTEEDVEDRPRSEETDM